MSASGADQDCAAGASRSVAGKISPSWQEPAPDREGSRAGAGRGESRPFVSDDRNARSLTRGVAGVAPSRSPAGSASGSVVDLLQVNHHKALVGGPLST